MAKIRLGSMSIGELRELIGRTQEEIAALETAPLPLSEATAALTKAVDALAATYAERLGPVLSL
jgi:hypothetical protein